MQLCLLTKPLLRAHHLEVDRRYLAVLATGSSVAHLIHFTVAVQTHIGYAYRSFYYLIGLYIFTLEHS